MVLKTIVKENVRKCLINSSNVIGSEYNLDTGDLLITYKSNRQYTYHNVTNEDYIRFEGASSQGKALNQFIKDKYEFSKMEEETPIDSDLYGEENDIEMN